jgi:hypothetical protein
LHVLFLYFGVVSGLKVNMAKLDLVLVDNVNNVVGLASILGCKVSSFPLKYLGLPPGAPFKTKSIWDSVIEKIERCLVGWKIMYLSN